MERFAWVWGQMADTAQWRFLKRLRIPSRPTCVCVNSGVAKEGKGIAWVSVGVSASTREAEAEPMGVLGVDSTSYKSSLSSAMSCCFATTPSSGTCVQRRVTVSGSGRNRRSLESFGFFFFPVCLSNKTCDSLRSRCSSSSECPMKEARSATNCPEGRIGSRFSNYVVAYNTYGTMSENILYSNVGAVPVCAYYLSSYVPVFANQNPLSKYLS